MSNRRGQEPGPVPESSWDVWCPNPDCEHGGHRWRVVGPGTESYTCAKCGAKMLLDRSEREAC